MKYCNNCGREIADEASFCPGCGAPVSAQNNSQYAGGGYAYSDPLESLHPIVRSDIQSLNTMSIIALAASILGVTVLPGVALIVGLVMGIIGLSKAKKIKTVDLPAQVFHEVESYRKRCLAAVIVSAVAIALACIAVILLLVLFTLGIIANTAPDVSWSEYIPDIDMAIRSLF